MSLTLRRHRFTVDELRQLAGAGLFDDRRVELLDGDLIDVTIKPLHAQAVTKLQKRFERTFGDSATIYSQNPLDLGLAHYLPQPDVMLIRPRVYHEHPLAADVLLLVEVADETLQKDESVKKPLYARAGVQDYWIADLNGRVWHVYRQPQGDGYGQHSVYGFDEAFSPLAFPDLSGVWLRD
jgi:Uma2 family endonuclease